MKTRSISMKEFSKINPDKLIYVCWVGSDDVLVVDGNELIEMAQEDNDDVKTLAHAATCMTKDQSGNSFEFIHIENGKPVKLMIDWPEE